MNGKYWGYRFEKHLGYDCKICKEPNKWEENYTLKKCGHNNFGGLLYCEACKIISFDNDYEKDCYDCFMKKDRQDKANVQKHFDNVKNGICNICNNKIDDDCMWTEMCTLCFDGIQKKRRDEIKPIKKL